MVRLATSGFAVPCRLAPLMSLPTPLRRIATRLRHLLRRKLRQTNRLSRKSLQMALLLGGAALVALVSLGFAYLADLCLLYTSRCV